MLCERTYTLACKAQRELHNRCRYRLLLDQSMHAVVGAEMVRQVEHHMPLRGQRPLSLQVEGQAIQRIVQARAIVCKVGTYPINAIHGLKEVEPIGSVWLGQALATIADATTFHY
jgi:hypothetical protein